MKHRLISAALVFMLCFLVCVNAYATSEDGEALTPSRGVVSVTYGFISKGNGQYQIWSKTETYSPENLKASVRIVKIVNGQEQTVNGGSASASQNNTTSLTAQKTLSLSAGTYRLYGSGSGNTSSDSKNKLIYIT